MTGISTLTGRMVTTFGWSASNSLTGIVYSPTNNASTITKTQLLGNNVGNTVTGGCDEVFSFQQGIVAGGSFTLNLNNMTNLLQTAGVALARIKGWQIRLLSGTDDSTLSPVPTATSTVTVTNIGPAVPSTLDFGNGGSGGTVALTTGGGAVTAVAVGAGGSGYPLSTFFLASPQQAGGSGNVFLCTTNGSGVITATTFIAGTGGAGYTNATVPLIPVGQYNIYTGGAHMYLDPNANGFSLCSATNQNVKILNMDAANAVTVEIDVFAATS